MSVPLTPLAAGAGVHLHDNRLLLDVIEEAVLAKLAANARHLVAAEGSRRAEHLCNMICE